jgi:hypothetical protein
MVRVLAVVVVMVGCGGGASAPRIAQPTPPTPSPTPTTPAPAPTPIAQPTLPLDRDMPRLAMRITGMYVAIADAVTTAGTDCARAATGVAAARDKNRDAIAATTAVVGDGRERDLEIALDPHAMTIAGALRRMSPSLDTCRDHAALNDALDKLGG